MLSGMEVIAHLLGPDGSIPNHPRWPLLVYPGAVVIEGAYPDGSHPETCVPPLARYQNSVKAVTAVPLPTCDPVLGPNGPLFDHWKRDE